MRDGSSNKIEPCFPKKMFQDDDHSERRERGDGDDESRVVHRFDSITRHGRSCCVWEQSRAKWNHATEGLSQTERQRAFSLDSFSLCSGCCSNRLTPLNTQNLNTIRTNFVFKLVTQPTCTKPMSSKLIEDNTIYPPGEDSASVGLPYVATVSLL
jgi:hypothetical protein